MTKLLMILVVGSTLVGCGATEDELRARAAFDMQCPQEQIRLINIDDHTVGVRGCGEQATYVELCRGAYNADCQWILNTDSRRVQ